MSYPSDVINERVNSICKKFTGNIDEAVSEFDEDKYCWFWGDSNYLWFDRYRLRQLLSYIKEHGLTNFTVNVYKVFDGGTSTKPKNQHDLEIFIIRPVPPGSFWIVPECYSPSGGRYVNTRVDIKLHGNQEK